MASLRLLLCTAPRAVRHSPASRRWISCVHHPKPHHTVRLQLESRQGQASPARFFAASPGYQRQFSASPSRSATVVTANPRQDDEGHDMLIEITPRAAKRLSEIMIQDENPALALRVTVQSGGCHGFQYLMSLASSQEASPEEDTIFEADDGSGARVIMDEPSLELLKGSQVDYTMELIGSQFKIVGNPAASSSCGCGTSFDIKT